LSTGTPSISAAVWRDDRVAAGADVGHVGLDGHRAAAIDAHARRRLRDMVVAERRGDPHADHQRPSRTLRGRASRTAPAEALGAVRRHCTSWRCENGRPSFSGSTWVSLRMRSSIRVDAELLGELVDRDLERHHSRGLAGARIALPSGRSSGARRVPSCGSAPA
jgi:hypothetical protein